MFNRSCCHETTKTSNFTCQSKSFISILSLCQVSACELQRFSCRELANEIYTHKLPKLCSATLNRKLRLRVLWKICSGCLLPVLAPHVLGNKQKKALMFPCPFNLVSILYRLVVPLRLYIKMRNRIHTSLKKVVLITNETRNLQKKRFFCKM